MDVVDDGAIDERPRWSTAWSANPLILAIVGALLAMSFAAINGYAIGFIDTRSYIHGAGLATKFVTGRDLVTGWKSVAPSGAAAAGQPKKKAAAFNNNGISANRSIYYGFVLLAGYVTSKFWLTLFIQAYVVAALVAIILRRCAPRAPVAVYLGTMLALALLTSLGPYVADLMPDIFTGAMIVAVGLLATHWRSVTRAERWFAVLVVAAALLFHPSNSAILMGLVAIAGLWQLARRTFRSHGAFYLVMVGCFAVAIAGQEMFSYGLERATGSRPVLLPHLTAHLIDMGPGYRYVVASCPQSGFAVCKFEDRLPIYWEDFVGLADPKRGVFAPADLATKRAMSSQQISFALNVLRFDPVGVITGLARDAGRQLVAFSPTGIGYQPAELSYFTYYFPADVARSLRLSRVGSGSGLLAAVGVANLALVCAGLVVLLVYGLRAVRSPGVPPSEAPIAGLVALLVSGVVVNAIVCGVFASPLDRYQGRVAWIIPLAAVLVALRRWEQVHARGEQRPTGVLDNRPA